MITFVLGVIGAAIFVTVTLRFAYVAWPRKRWVWFVLGYHYLVFVPLLVAAYLGEWYGVGEAAEVVGFVTVATAVAGTMMWNAIDWRRRSG